MPTWRNCTTIWEYDCTTMAARPHKRRKLMKRTLGLVALAASLACGTAYAQQKQIDVKVGVLTDMASLYADDTGIGSVIAAKMAAEDFMKKHPNVKVSVVSADHQNK